MAGLPVEDGRAAQLIYEECFDQLVISARSKLNGSPRRESDEEDIASSVLGSFFRGVDQGRFSGRLSRAQLWALLRTIADRKVAKRYRRRATQRRGAGRELGEADLQASEGSRANLELLVATPADQISLAQVRECLRLLIAGLEDPLCESVLMLRLAGYTHAEIADRLGYSVRTVERKIVKVQRLWARLSPPT